MNQEETELIADIIRGNKEAYTVLIDRYKDGLYYHCYRFMHDENDAKDITQQAFIDAYVHLVRYDSKYRFSTWLYKIATNLAISKLRKRHEVRLSEGEIDTIISDLPTIEELSVYEDLHAAIKRLPPQQRKAIELHYWQGKKYDEIATALGATAGTVKSWISRAKKQLKEEIL